jgi:hypothetical protein
VTQLGLRLVVVGTGRSGGGLAALAGPGVRLAGRVDGEELRRLYRGATCFVQPGVEDFGIASVEALACGTPVVALDAGGVLDIVEDGTPRRPLPRRRGDVARSPRPLTSAAECGSIRWTFAPGPRRSPMPPSRRIPCFDRTSAEPQGARVIRSRHRKTAGLYLLVDLFAVLVAFSLAYWLRFDPLLEPFGKNPPESWLPYAKLLPVVLVLWPVVFYFHGLYQVRRGRSRVDELLTLLVAVLLATVLLSRW